MKREELKRDIEFAITPYHSAAETERIMSLVDQYAAQQVYEEALVWNAIILRGVNIEGERANRIASIQATLANKEEQ